MVVMGVKEERDILVRHKLHRLILVTPYESMSLVGQCRDECQCMHEWGNQYMGCGTCMGSSLQVVHTLQCA